MSSCYNSGTLRLKGVTKKNMEAVKKAIDDSFDDWSSQWGESSIHFDEKTMALEFDGTDDKYLDDEIRDFVERVGKLGVSVSGVIDYTSDWDGFYHVKDGKVASYDVEAKLLVTGKIQTIRAYMRDRGYDVVKREGGHA